MTVDTRGDYQPRVEQVLARAPATFSTQMLDAWAGAHDHLSFRYTQPVAGQARVSRSVEGAMTVVVLPNNPNLGDLLSASRLVDINSTHNERSRLEVLSKNLTDSAILMSRDPAFRSAEFDPVIEKLYGLGQVLSGGVQGEVVASLAREQIQQAQIQLPPGADPKAYENGLYLFLLGKNAVLSNPKVDKPLQVDPQHSFYTALYDRWRSRRLAKRSAIAGTHDEEEYKREFDNWLISRRPNITRVLSRYVAGSLEIGRGARALDELTEQAIEGHLDKKVAQRGREITEADLKVHRHSEDMGFDAESAVGRIFLDEVRDEIHELNIKYSRRRISRQDLDQAVSEIYNKKLEDTPLFKITESMLQKRVEHLQGREQRMNSEGKIKFLWDIVQAYDFAWAGVPQKAIETEEFECNLRASVLGQMIEKFFPDDFVVLGDWVKSHMRLIVVDKKEIPYRLPKSYFVDPTRSRYSREDGVRVSQERNTHAIRQVGDQNLLRDIVQAYKQNPDQILIHSDTWGPSYGVGRRELNHSIGNYRNLTEAGMWGNMAILYVQNQADRAYCFRKAVELVPVSGDAWLGLADSTVNPQEKSEYLQKAVELNPHDTTAWYELARGYDRLRYPWQFKDIKPAEIIKIWERFLFVQSHWPNDYNQSHRGVAEIRINELKDLARAEGSKRKKLKYRVKRVWEKITEGV